MSEQSQSRPKLEFKNDGDSILENKVEGKEDNIHYMNKVEFIHSKILNGVRQDVDV